MKNAKRIIRQLILATLVFCNLIILLPQKAANAEQIIPVDISLSDGTIPRAVNKAVFEGVSYSVESLPSAKSPSLCLVPQVGGMEAYLDVVLPTQAKQVVIDSSIRFDGTPASLKRVFTVTDTNKNSNVLGLANKDGTFTLNDKTFVANLNQGVFNDITYLIDCDKKVYSLMINGKTLVEEYPFPNNAMSDVNKIRFQVSSIVSSGEIDEKIYLNYIRIYNSDRVLSDAEYKEVLSSIKTYKQPVDERDNTVTAEMISAAMEGNVLFYMNSSRARVGDTIAQIDGENAEIAPLLLDNTTMVPLRFLTESLGAQVTYDEGDSKATVTLDGNTVSFTQGEKKYSVNGEEKELPVAPYTKDGRIFIPLRGISEGLGKKVFWDRAGYVAVGDSVDEFDMSTDKGRKLIFETAVNLIYDFPSQETVLRDFAAVGANKHPRISLTSERLEELKTEIKTDEYQKYWYEQLIKRCEEKHLPSEPVKYGRTDGTRMLETSRLILERVPELALGYLLSGKTEYKERAIDELMNVCTFPDWNPYHFLDTAEMSRAVSMGYDWLYYELTDEQRTTIETAIKEYALEEILRDFNNEAISNGRRTWEWWSWENPSYPQNWVSECTGGVGSGALAVMDVYPEIASEVISRGFRHIADLQCVYGPDGSTDEGATYWAYACRYFANYSSALVTSCGTDYGMFEAPGMHEFMHFADDFEGPAGGFTFNKGTQSGDYNTKFLLWFARRFNRPDWLNAYMDDTMDTGFKTGSAETMIWYKPEYLSLDYETSKREVYKRSFEYVSMRTGGNSDTEMMLGFVGKMEGSTHQHAGSFILDALGLRWSRDPGTDDAMYNTATNQEEYYRFRTDSHSTVAINPNMGLSQNPYKAAYMEAVESGDNTRYAICNMSDCYKFLGTQSVRRGIMLDKERQYVTVRDEITAKENMDFYWLFQTGADVEISEDGKRAVLSQHGKRFAVEILSEGDFTFTVMDAGPLPLSPHKLDAADETGYRTLVIHTQHLSEVNLTVGMTPLFGDETEAAYKGSVLPLDEWKVDLNEHTPPVLSNLCIDGERVDGFTPDNRFYSTDIKQGAPAPVISAECSDAYEVSIVQPTKDNVTSRITVTEKANPDNFRIYYINFTEVPAATGEPTFPAEKLEVKSVYAEDIPQAANVPKNVIDGDYSTRWASQKIGTAIDFDLGSSKEINYVGMAMSVGDQRKTKFTVMMSEDKTNWTQIYSGWTPGTTTDLVLYNVGEVKARYVRVLGYGNDNGVLWFSPTEINFWDKLNEE